MLLQEQTYDLSATTEPLIVDNHGLYGRGEAQTTLKLSLTQGVVVLSDWGASVTIADLAMEGDSIGFLQETVAKTLSTLGSNAPTAARLDEVMVKRTISLPAVSGVAEHRTEATLSELGALAGAVPKLAPLTAATRVPRAVTLDGLAHAPEVALAPAGLSTPRMTLRNVSYSEVAGGGYVGIPPIILPSLDLTLTDVTIDAGNSFVMLVSTRNVTLERVSVTSDAAVVGSYGGTFDVRDSNVQAATDIGLWSEAGMTVTGSTIRAADGSIQVIGAANTIVGGNTEPTGGAIEISTSTVEALDGNLADGTAKGTLVFVTQFAPIGLTDNVLLRSHDSMNIVTQQSLIGEGGITLTGNGDVRAGVFKSEDAVNFRPAAVEIDSLGGGSIATIVRLDGNTIAATAAVMVDLSGSGNPAFLAANQNVLTAGDGDNNGVILLKPGAKGELRLENNVLSSDRVVEVEAVDLLGTTAVLRANTVSAKSAAAPTTLVDLTGGSCELAGNTFEAANVGATSLAALLLTCTGVDPLVDTFTVTGNTMTARGNGSSVFIAQFGDGALTMASNQVATEAAFQVTALGIDAQLSANDIELEDGYWLLAGNSFSDFTLDANVVTYEDPLAYGLVVTGAGNSSVTGNEFTVSGTPAPAAVAFVFATGGAPITMAASGNTFTNFSRALYVADQATTAWGITATVEDNVFDFPIDAAPKAAELFNVKSAIDARNNQWGTNTSAATVTTYVTLSGDTVAQGGSILLNPITLP